MYKFRGSIAQIPYGACKAISVKGRSLVVEYKKGGRIEKFFGIAGKEKKKIIHLLKTLPIGKQPSEIAQRSFLCPRCAAPLTENHHVCQKCDLKFKTNLFAVLNAIFMPGGGYFYIRQYLLGSMAAILELFLFVVAGISLMDTLNGMPNSLIRLLLGVLALVVVKVVSGIHICTFIGEFIPSKKKFKKKIGKFKTITPIS